MSSSLIRLETAIESVPGAVGLALIITNDYKGNPSFGNLDATESDGDAMESAFKELGYATIRQHNATLVWLMSVLNKADHTTWPPSCKRLAFVFAGHGRNPRSPDETGTQLVTSDGRNISINTIVKKLSAQSKGSTIGDMVRMFFIDACRGDLEDQGMMVHRGGDLAKETRVSINATNYILCFSTLAGFRSYEMKEKGESCGIWLPLVAEKISTCDLSISDAMTEVNIELMSRLQDKSKYTMMMQPECNQYLNETVNLLKEKPASLQVATTRDSPHCVELMVQPSCLSSSASGITPSGLPPAPSLSRTLSTPDHSIAAGGSLPSASVPMQQMVNRVQQSPHHRAGKLAATFSTVQGPTIPTVALPTQPQLQQPMRCGPQATVPVPTTNIHVPELVQRHSPQISSGHYRGLLNQCMQNNIITPSYTSNWSTDEKHDQLRKVFRATVKCVLVSDESIIIGDSKMYYDGKKGAAQEMAAKDAYDQIQQRMKISFTPNLPAIPPVQATLLPEAAATCSVPQPVIATVTSPPSNRVYKQELNNFYQGQLRLDLPTYETKHVADGFQSIASHQHFQSIFGCRSIEGQVCRTKKEAENSTAWRVWALLGKT